MTAPVGYYFRADSPANLSSYSFIFVSVKDDIFLKCPQKNFLPLFVFTAKHLFPISTEFCESVTLKLPTDQILSILNFLEVLKLFFVSGQIPEDARSNAWVSFDGKRRQQLSRGDSVRIFMSQHPLPTVNKADQTGDWFRSLIRCLNWNERLDQKAL